MSYCSNGDLLGLITKQGQFSVDKARFYSAEIVDALEYMHGKKVVHRDLKPEVNIDMNTRVRTKTSLVVSIWGYLDTSSYLERYFLN